ncbi:transporter substrate-binding domain-containing protein [Pseudoduganella namucuonensis]|uniref:Amino acid ABC transporter substrate-binding protein, PAAT family n=1 Tax=Pseudoduganella namucuonensis TaxID=1035707 RepID=A0A1I7KSJ0_9BURK|nr:transporter substrate-binding domain-containing protein [Pseudoduganella namucuonensis]SFV00387.1 amino acid ABC transporter substrate-binding protein, PAAT family [Pseudoduganella namucuonensis]
MDNISGFVAAEFLTNGRLRAAINLGNPILASQPPGQAQPSGVSVDLARELARRLDVELEMVVFNAAGLAAAALAAGSVNIGFVAIDPQRGEGIRFTPPYVQIEGSYLVREESPLRAKEEVDRQGIRVAVGLGSAYDLYLGRTLKHAQLVRAATSPSVVDTFLHHELDVAAGVRQQLEYDAERFGGLRMLDGRFMTINQAMGLPLRCSDGAWRLLCGFVEELKSGGFVADALARHGIDGAAVAPPAI